jgi:hypothetical protein
MARTRLFVRDPTHGGTFCAYSMSWPLRVQEESKAIITRLINDHDDSAQAAVLKRFIITISTFHRPCWLADKCAAL